MTKVAAGTRGGRRRDGGYNSEDDEDIEEMERRRRERELENERMRQRERQRQRERDPAYQDGAQFKEVTKVAAGMRGGRRGGAGYNSDDDEDFSSEGGFDASEESYVPYSCTHAHKQSPHTTTRRCNAPAHTQKHAPSVEAVHCRTCTKGKRYLFYE